MSVLRKVATLGMAACLLAVSLDAAARMTWFRTTDTSFSWRGDVGSIGLDRVDGGLQVNRLDPDTLWGLRKGDVVESIDGRAIDSVPTFTKRLGDTAAGPARLSVRRGGTKVIVVIAVADYAQLGIPHEQTPPTPAAAEPADDTDDGGMRYLRIDDDLVSWRGGDQRLLVVDDGKGLSVSKLSPASLWGLQQGDRIVTVDGRVVQNVRELLDTLRDAQGHDTRWNIERASEKKTIKIPSSDYRHLLDPR